MIHENQPIANHAGIDHLNSVLRLHTRDAGIDKCLTNISNNTGNPSACIGSIQSASEAMALLEWFGKSNLPAFKDQCYAASKLERILFQRQPYNRLAAFSLFYPLMSDHEQLIDWYAGHNLWLERHSKGYAKDFQNHKTVDFFDYQAFAALRGEWAKLEERCERILADPPSSQKKSLIDHRFYLALTRGDHPEMEAALTELTSPKVARVRNFGPAFGITERFISIFACVYAKIAWRHGYQLKIDTPFIPAEWLPLAPLPAYTDPYPFMAEFDIDTPIEIGN